jgi:hypothetical protein
MNITSSSVSTRRSSRAVNTSASPRTAPLGALDSGGRARSAGADCSPQCCSRRRCRSSPMADSRRPPASASPDDPMRGILQQSSSRPLSQAKTRSPLRRSPALLRYVGAARLTAESGFGPPQVAVSWEARAAARATNPTLVPRCTPSRRWRPLPANPRASPAPDPWPCPPDRPPVDRSAPGAVTTAPVPPAYAGPMTLAGRAPE